MECNYLVVTESSAAASVLEFSTVHEAWFSQKARSEADSQVVPKAVWPLDRAVCGSIVNDRAKCVSASTRPVISERYKCAQTCQRCARGKPSFHSLHGYYFLFYAFATGSNSTFSSIRGLWRGCWKVRLPRQQLFPGQWASEILLISWKSQNLRKM